MIEGAAVFLSLLCCASAAIALQRVAIASRSGPLLPLERENLLRLLRTRPVRRAGEAITALLGMQACCLFLLLTARPFMAFLLVSAVLTLLVVFNCAKERILREPLVLADAWLLKQIFKYPEMYFPFLPLKGIFVGLGVLALVLFGLTRLEPPLACLRTPGAAITLALLFCLPVALLLLLRRSRFPRFAALLLRLCPVGNDAAKDALENGPLTSAMLHPVLAGLWEREGKDFLAASDTRPKASHWPEAFEAMLQGIGTKPAGEREHVLIIQAESFADIRPLLPEKNRTCLAKALPNWESLARRGHILPTPDTAFGAYTMRTEFTVLTGLSKESLGPFSFNPYLLAGRQKLWSLARFFKKQGYTTLCLHPYYRDFFRRDKVMDNLGFDHFWGIEDLSDLPCFGPHTSDLALAAFLREKLDASDKPVFAFVITMEAHGPWKKGRLTMDEVAQTLGSCDNAALSDDVRMYLCHLLRMDAMLGLLEHGETDASAKAASKGTGLAQHPVSLWAYGDHDPALSITRSH